MPVVPGCPETAANGRGTDSRLCQTLRSWQGQPEMPQQAGATRLDRRSQP